MASSLSLDVDFFFFKYIYLVGGCLAVSYDFDVFVRGGELKFYFSILSPFNILRSKCGLKTRAPTSSLEMQTHRPPLPRHTY